MKIQEITTDLSPEEVIARARAFMGLTGAPSAAFPEEHDDHYLRMHMEVGEIMISALRRDGKTVVRGSASRASQLVSRFLMTLGAPFGVSQSVHRRGVDRQHGAVSLPLAKVIAPAASNESAQRSLSQPD